MKKYIIMLFLICQISFSYGLSWRGDYNKALQEAKEQNKYLLVLLIKNNCQKCKDVIVKSFTNKPYLDKLREKFLAVIVNFDAKYSYPIEMYYSNNFPALFFTDPKTETFILKPLHTLISPNDIKEILKKIKSNGI